MIVDCVAVWSEVSSGRLVSLLQALLRQVVQWASLIRNSQRWRFTFYVSFVLSWFGLFGVAPHYPGVDVSFGVSYYLAILLLPFYMVAEIAALLLVSQAIRELLNSEEGSRFFALFGVVCLFFLLFVYCSLVLLGWYFYYLNGNAYFPNLSDVLGFVRRFEISWLLAVLSIGDIVFCMQLVGGVIGVLCFLVYMAPPLRKKRTVAGLLLASISIPYTFFSIIPSYRFSEDVSPIARYRFRAHLAALSAPQASLPWSFLLVGMPPQRTFLLEDSSSRLKPFVDYRTSARTSLRKPHVILIVVEALRGDLIGKDSKAMPFVSSLAQRGIHFSRAFSNGTITFDAQTSLLTGMLPLTNELVGPMNLIEYPFNLLSILEQEGYSSQVIWETPSSIEKQIGMRTTSDRAMGIHQIRQRSILDREVAKTKALLNWIKDNRDTPTFSTIYYYASHFTHYSSDDHDHLTQKPFAPFTIPRSVRFGGYQKDAREGVFNRYRNLLRFIDHEIEKIYGSLKRENLLENTIFIITGDHGEFFLEHGLVGHGARIMNSGVHVPIVFYGSSLRPLTHTTYPISHIDVPPTVLWLAAKERYAGFQGDIVVTNRSDTLPPPRKERPVFILHRAISFEDAMICWPYRIVMSGMGNRTKVHDLRRDWHERNPLSSPELHDKYRALLETFQFEFEVFKTDNAQGKRRLFAPSFRQFTCPSISDNSSTIPLPIHSATRNGVRERYS